MSYTAIVNGTIDAYSPVIGARIFKPMRDNDNALTIQIVNPVVEVSASAASTAYVTLATVKLYIPSFMVGSGGTRLHAWARAEVTAGAGSDNASVRFQIAGTNSNEITASASAFGSDIAEDFADVDWTPTADTIVSVLIQGKRSAGATANAMAWSASIRSYMIRLPDPT